VSRAVREDVLRRRVIARGLVQGVFFRDTLRNAADREHVAGWVRNNRDGTVEAVFEGDAGAVERLVALAREGPPGARVEELELLEEPDQGEVGFRIR
jgi:acylphosphatase